MSQERPQRGLFAELLDFARNNMIWWLTPIVLVLLLLVILAVMGSGGDSGFTYDLF